ncbi:nitrate/nitrite transporter NarK [Paraburkholderia sp. GAS41]|uniref:MFS transporter n=1 Tax=Paraburkholderia sp. GAS41 TaxID=3035134 RepID=UPI003D230F49
MNQPSNIFTATGIAHDRSSYAERNALYWRRNLVICVFGSFTTLVSLSMLLPFLPLYVQQLGVSSQGAVVQWSGVAFGTTFLGTAATAPLWGRLADRYGRKPMLVRAAIGMAIVMSLIGLAQNVVELVALRLVAGLVAGYASAAIVMIGTQAPRERSRSILIVFISEFQLTAREKATSLRVTYDRHLDLRHMHAASMKLSRPKHDAANPVRRDVNESARL